MFGTESPADLPSCSNLPSCFASTARSVTAVDSDAFLCPGQASVLANPAVALGWAGAVVGASHGVTPLPAFPAGLSHDENLLGRGLCRLLVHIQTSDYDIRPAVVPSEDSSPPQPQATGPLRFAKLGVFFLAASRVGMALARRHVHTIAANVRLLHVGWLQVGCSRGCGCQS